MTPVQALEDAFAWANKIHNDVHHRWATQNATTEELERSARRVILLGSLLDAEKQRG